MIAITGPSGCGKSTLVDILTGLLVPKNGELIVDNEIITKKNLRLWQNSIGYVPQNIYLSDDAIASNIAFGLDDRDIDYKRVENCAKIAQIHDLIENELPKKYLTKIGERGIRLSGGQCQRLGLARALYYDPKLLVLDEATNALDFKNEQKIMHAIYSLKEDITIIVIAHRFNTIRNYDILLKFENGQFISKKNNHIS
jgi:ABC-type multidrug transport system fused ATPase/permease subunit